jgi:hypothetical protein
MFKTATPKDHVMPKKTVTTTPSPSATPVPNVELTGTALELFEKVQARWSLDAVAGQLLRLACESIQRANACAEITKTEGLTIKDRWGQPKSHPAALLERDHRNSAANSLQKLGLNLE